MAGYIFDLDGTLLEYHTNKWLKGAKELLQRRLEQGDTVLIITMRHPVRDAQTVWNVPDTKAFLEAEGFGEIPAVFGFDSPRTLIDDSEIDCHRRRTNEPWSRR